MGYCGKLFKERGSAFLGERDGENKKGLVLGNAVNTEAIQINIHFKNICLKSFWNYIHATYMWQQNQPRVVYFQTTGKLLVKKTDLQALTLVGLSRQDPEPDPLAVLHLNNWLYIMCYVEKWRENVLICGKICKWGLSLVLFI